MDKPLYPELTKSTRVSWDWFAQQIAKMPVSDHREIARKAHAVIAGNVHAKQK